MGPKEEAIRLLATREGQWAFERERRGSVTDLLRASGAHAAFPLLPTFRHVVEAQAWSGWTEVTAWAWQRAKELGLDTTPPDDGLPPNPVSSWEAYFEVTGRLPLHPLYRTLESHLPATGEAVELGSGNGPGPLFLVDRGLDVLAVDGHGMALASLYARATEVQRPRLACRVARLQEVFLAPQSVDVLVAGYCLFFLSSVEFGRLWENMNAALRPGGVMMGQFLGPNDDWASTHLTHRPEEVRELLAPFETLYLEEAERDGHTSQGVPKHWHVYHWIVRRTG